MKSNVIFLSFVNNPAISIFKVLCRRWTWTCALNNVFDLCQSLQKKNYYHIFLKTGVLQTWYNMEEISCES